MFHLLVRPQRAMVKIMKTTKVFKFRHLGTAQDFANNCNKMHGVILGDDARFWVVSMAAFDRLLKGGYEAA